MFTMMLWVFSVCPERRERGRNLKTLMLTMSLYMNILMIARTKY